MDNLACYIRIINTYQSKEYLTLPIPNNLIQYISSSGILYFPRNGRQFYELILIWMITYLKIKA